MIFYRLFTPLLLLLVTACAGKPLDDNQTSDWSLRQQQMTSIEQWMVKGRIGIKTPDQGFSSNLSWQRNKEHQLFRIYGSFGKTYAVLTRNADTATVKLSDDEVIESTNVEQLLHQVLGYPLPVEHLQYWILGMPSPGNDSELTFNPMGNLEAIQYQQWNISYTKYKRFSPFDNYYLPSKIIVTNGEVTLRLALRTWSKDSAL